MANIVKNIGGVTKEIVTQLYNEASVVKGVQRRYSEQFGVEGAKIGDVLNVKYLDNPPITRGPVMQDYPIVERTIPVQILKINQYQASIKYNSADYKLSIESFTEKRNLKQTARKLANELDADCARLFMQFPMTTGTLNTTPGTAGGVGNLMSTAPNIYTNAGAIMTAYSAPTGERTMALNPAASGLSVSSLAGLQNPASEISRQYRSGRMGAETLGFDFIENVNLPSFTTGTRSINAGIMNGNTADGATTLNLTGLGANATIKVGEHFSIAGVNLVNPMSQLTQGYLQQFAVLADVTADAAGSATVSISPSIILSNPESMIGGSMVRRYPLLPINVNGTVDALPLAGAAITFSGAASTSGVFNCGFHKDAIVMTAVQLPTYEGNDKCAQENFEGFNVRVWRQSDIKNDSLYCRVDTIVVFTMIRKELGIIVWG